MKKEHNLSSSAVCGLIAGGLGTVCVLSGMLTLVTFELALEWVLIGHECYKRDKKDG